MNKLQQQMKRWFGGKKEQRPFQLVQVETSLTCSLDCVMCPWTEIRAQGGAMSMDTFHRIASLFPLAKNVDLTGGGEPLTNPNLVEMVRSAASAGCQVGFSTNATRLTPVVADALVEAGIDWISFSMDAATPERYERIRQGAAFETVVENITYLRDLKQRRSLKKPQFMMVFVAQGGDPEIQNYQELPQFIELAKNLGVEQVIIKNLDVILTKEDDQRRLFTHDGASLGEIEKYIHEAKTIADQSGIKLRRYLLHPQEQAVCEHNPTASVFFNWEGWVSPCITQSYAEERVFDGEIRQTQCVRFGNINQMTFEEIWNQTAYHAWRDKFAQRQMVERRQMFNALLNEEPGTQDKFPPPPAGCESCYYLYGI